MSHTDSTKAPWFERYLEIAVPLVSFGVTFAGILLWQAGITIGFQYFSAGCLAGSCILAYLAWIRPRKDIVALSTPLYAFIFFVVPTEYAPAVMLQVLYAASLTILLVRLKYRFGETTRSSTGETFLPGSLRAYVDRVAGAVPVLSPEQARLTGSVVVRFSTGEYAEAARLADRAGDQLAGVDGTGVLIQALAIVSEQAATTDRCAPRPEAFLTFSPAQEPLLAHPVPAGTDREPAYTVTLYNALLVLFAAAWLGAPADHDLLVCRTFAQKLAEAP
jgi:hypothetical protein